MITELTAEQKTRFAEFINKWTKIGLSTAPADRVKAEQGINQIYAIAGLKAPKIIWCTSPLANGLTRAVIKEMRKKSKREDSVRASVWDSVWASVWDSVGASVGASVWASVGASVGDSVGDSVWASVRASVWDSVRASVGDSVWASVWDSVWASVGDSVWASVGASVWASVGASVWDSGYGQHDAPRLAFYDYLCDVCGLTNQTTELHGHWLIAQSAGWYLPHKNICWVSERHNILRLNNSGRLHCGNSMALSYPDGWGIYALNGVMMKPEYVLTPAEKITPETVLAEKNVDIRRELIRKVGVQRMLSQGKEIDRYGTYKLIDMSPVLTGVRFAPHLLMRNPSVDDTWHLEGVGPECHTVQEAINWRAGNIGVEWSPAQLS